jgi:hypothetical protein
MMMMMMPQWPAGSTDNVFIILNMPAANMQGSNAQSTKAPSTTWTTTVRIGPSEHCQHTPAATLCRLSAGR